MMYKKILLIRLLKTIVCTLVLQIAVAANVYAENVASIVLGSYVNIDNATRCLETFAPQLDLSLQIAEATVRGTKYFRILSNPRDNIGKARVEMQKIKATVAPDAWLLIELRRDVQHLSTRADAGSGILHAPADLDKEEQAVDQGKHKQQTDQQPSSLRPSKVGMQVQAQRITSALRVGLDATKQPIVLPRYDNVDITIDGRLDESIWSQVPGYDNMAVIQPDTLEAGRYRTETKFLYTDRGFYLGIYNEQPKETLIERLSMRDQYTNRDYIELSFDPTGEGLYGYYFGVSLGGSLNDGTILPEWVFSKEWDGPWYGNAVETDGGWSAEMFLPWSMMAMPESAEERLMSLYIARRIAHLDEWWSWPALPITGSKFISALQPVQLRQVNPRQQFSLFPYASATYDHLDGETDYRIGADIFWRPTSDLQLALGINPDFGTVESDDVVINLTAFETFFPEKRLFFLEGHEVFNTSSRSSAAFSSSGGSARRTASNYNWEPMTLVNTRRIGGPARTPDIPSGVLVPGVELGKPSELLGAVKATGQHGPFRYGLMGAFEKDSTFRGLDAGGNHVQLQQDGRDFGVARFLYENTGSGRRALGWISTLVSHPEEDAVVHGIDAHYLSPGSKLKWDGQLIYSDVGNVQGGGGFFDLLYYQKQGLYHSFSFDYFDKKLDVSDLGFIRRNDAINLSYSYSYSTSDLKHLRSRSNRIYLSQNYNTDGIVVRSGIFWYTYWTFHNLSQIRTELDYFPSRWDDRNSWGNGRYRIPQRWVSEVSYGTDTSRKVSVSAALGQRQEDNGAWRTTAKGGISYKPNDHFSLDLDVNYSQSDGWLVYQGGRQFTTFKTTDWQPSLAMGLFFTARQQLRLTMQWAGIRAEEKAFFLVPESPGRLIEVSKPAGDPTDDFAISMLTAQVRYQWEIAPLSDLFIVYTRGANLPDRIDDGFSGLFHDALMEPIIDYIVIKLRYRFGN